MNRPDDARQGAEVAVLSIRRIPWADRMLAGIRDFSERGPHWRFFIVRHDSVLFPSCLDEFRGQGVIVCGEATPRRRDMQADPELDLGRPDLPAVWAGWPPSDSRTTVWPDYHKAGCELTQHLIDRGFRHVGYFDACDMPHNTVLWAGVEEVAKQNDVTPERFIHGPRGRPGEGWRLESQLIDLAEWLVQRERPFSLVAADDTHAQRAIEAAHRAGLRVPEDVAIVGVGNDEDFCQFASPSITSIDLRPERLGFAAAEQLSEMIACGGDKPRAIALEPGNLIVRQSSDVLGTRDSAVAAAVRYIADHIEEPIRVDDLVQHTGLSRSSLQRRFTSSLGYCPGEAIRRTRVDEVRRLLNETRLPLADIAVRCGFGYVSQMSRDFKRATGLSPSAFRFER